MFLGMRRNQDLNDKTQNCAKSVGLVNPYFFFLVMICFIKTRMRRPYQQESRLYGLQ